MGSGRSIFIRLVALAIIFLGWKGMEKSHFKRRVSWQISYTISSATPKDLDEIYAEMSAGRDWIERNENAGPNRLAINAFGESWNDSNKVTTLVDEAMRTPLAKRKLSTQGRSWGSNYTQPTGGKSLRYAYLGSAMLALIGIAMFVLSFRVFGGGRPEESPLEDAKASS